MFRYLLFVLLLAAVSCSDIGQNNLSKAERNLISSQGQVMRVLTVDNPEDSIFLRKKSVDFSDRDLNSPTFIILAGKMVSTVTDPSQDGVGIAGPQVGLARRIIAVQRFDKEGEPFEVYPNVRIESLSGEIVSGQEGCLSVPGERGSVPRYSTVVVSYKDPLTLKTVNDTVEGFTAVIFQHEIDHLEGILYTDRADSLWVAEK